MEVLSFKKYIVEASDLKIEFDDLPADIRQTLTRAGYKNSSRNTVSLARSNLFWIVYDNDPHLGSLELGDIIKNRNFTRILKNNLGNGIKILFKLQQISSNQSY